jgi:ATP-dependent DNA helicase DinG
VRLDSLASLALALDAQRELDAEDEPDGPSPVERNAEDLRSAADGLRRAFDEDDTQAVVASFEGLVSPYDRWRLSLRAVAPAAIFHDQFMQKLESFAAVSASLFVSGDPFASLGELELEDRSLLPLAQTSVDSPFPYRENMRVVALDLKSDLVRETADAIATVARELGGRTLGLFTSLRRMNEVAEILSRELRPDGFDILAPRASGDDPNALVQRFCRAGGGGVLLGARTFWQGLDIPGSALQAVVIEKLPFEVPTELRRRRENRIRETGGDAFARFSTGKMLLHLKQMSGRLIRTEDDRGIVVIVEGRTAKPYFRRLQEAIPAGVEIQRASREEIPAILSEIGLGRRLSTIDPES